MCERREEAVPVAGGGEAAEVRQHVCYGILFIDSTKADAGPAGDSRNGREGLSPEELGNRDQFIMGIVFAFMCYREWEESGDIQ